MSSCQHFSGIIQVTTVDLGTIVFMVFFSDLCVVREVGAGVEEGVAGV